jgi:hypothetical protein
MKAKREKRECSMLNVQEKGARRERRWAQKRE